MIAVALVPPAATVGIGIAYGDPSMAVASGVLVVVNLLSINLAALAVLWYSGYRPPSLFREDDARSATVRRVAVLVAVIALLSVFLGGVTYDSFRTAAVESEIETEVGDLFAAEGPYPEMRAFDTTVTFAARDPAFLLHDPASVVVTVGVPPDAETDGVAAAVDAVVTRVAGPDVEVQVRFVPYRTG
jgi:uncharacterized membrane protein